MTPLAREYLKDFLPTVKSHHHCDDNEEYWTLSSKGANGYHISKDNIIHKKQESEDNTKKNDIYEKNRKLDFENSSKKGYCDSWKVRKNKNIDPQNKFELNKKSSVEDDKKESEYNKFQYGIDNDANQIGRASCRERVSSPV